MVLIHHSFGGKPYPVITGACVVDDFGTLVEPMVEEPWRWIRAMDAFFGDTEDRDELEMH